MNSKDKKIIKNETKIRKKIMKHTDAILLLLAKSNEPELMAINTIGTISHISLSLMKSTIKEKMK